MEQGVLYVCSGDAYHREARRSAQSVREVMPDVSIGIISNRDTCGNVFDVEVEIENAKESIYDKSNNIHRSPFEKTIYLDTDTYITTSINTLFDLLESNDLAAAHAPRLSFSEEDEYPDLDIPDAFPQYNTGVIAFRDTGAVQELFHEWRQFAAEHRANGFETDQMAFRKALYGSDCNFVTLRQEYNCLIYFGQYLNGPVKIVHGHGDLEEIAEILNEETRSRTFIKVFNNKVILVDEKSRSTPELFIDSIKTEGILQTLRRVWRYIRRDARFKD